MIPQKYLQKLKMELAGTLLQAGDPGYDRCADDESMGERSTAIH